MVAEPGQRGLRVDWAKSKAVVSGLHVYVNLKGRDPEGIVEPEDYDSVCEEIVRLLRGWRDQDGEHPMGVVLHKQDAPLIGFWGDGVGDVVFLYAGGFAWEQGQVPEGQTVIPGHGANHGPQLATTETAVSSNHCLVLMAGPGVRRGHVRDEATLGPARLVDLAPTVAHLLDIPPPAQSQGQILWDLLEGHPGGVVREARPLPFAAPEAASEELRYASDVTDQA
jgi:predicted AlkP superfamily phosphohydrolase/phosphomutase